MNFYEDEILNFLKGLDADACEVSAVDLSVPLRVFVAHDAKGAVVAVVPVRLRFFEEGGRVEELRRLRGELRLVSRSEQPFVLGDGMTIGGAARGDVIAQEVIFIYEDRWRAAGPLVRSMLAVRLGRGESVYARNCEVREVSAEVAADFLGRNHLYGSTRSAYRYGLFRRRATGRNEAQMMDTTSLVAVATFSAGKLFSAGGVSGNGSSSSMYSESAGAGVVVDNHAASVISYEWIRYASAKGTRVVGGMGRLLDAFVSRRRQELFEKNCSRICRGMNTGEDAESGQSPEVSAEDAANAGVEWQSGTVQVMSYADLEWTGGDSYSKLGFEAAGERESVEFLCDPSTMARIHAGKFSTDRKFRSASTDGYIRICNLGSRKFIRKW